MSDYKEIYPLKVKAGQKFFTAQSCLYSNQIDQLPPGLLDDDRCALTAVSEARLPALYCRDQLMAVRFFPKTWAAAFAEEKISAKSLEDLIFAELVELRTRKLQVIGQSTEALRWVHGDADGLPGIVIDDYGPLVVVQSGSQFGDFLLPNLITALLRATEKPIFERSSGQIRALEKLPERTRWIRELQGSTEKNSSQTVKTQLAGLPLQFTPHKCQKTGLFLDQRENLKIFQTFVASVGAQSMLDVCSYVGAWSCAGANTGVREFTLIDQDKDALALAQTNIDSIASSKNRGQITTLHGDFFEGLAKLQKEQKKFSAVVADPPAFTKSAKHVPEAKRAYQRLTKLASRLVSAGGLYVACSCSRHIDEEDFYQIVSGALESDDWIYLGRGRQSADHTVLATDKQSLYLKALFFLRRQTLTQFNPRAEKNRGAEH